MRRAIELLEYRMLFGADLVADINSVVAVGQAGPAGSQMYDLNGTLYFTWQGRLWKSDKTPAGTVEVSSAQVNPTEFASLNGSLYFNGGGQLWKSDGTDTGTISVAPVGMNPRNIVAAGSRLFFRGNDGGGEELWTSDGTVGGTVRVKDINPGGASSEPRQLTNVNGTLFFRAHDADSGDELWKSDGTTAGTVRVKDILPGAGGSEPFSFTAVGGTLFFTAHDAIDSGYELWKSDGSEIGTVRVKDIRPGKPGSSPSFLRNVNGSLMFVATDGITGYELWKSDGSEMGTVLVKDIIAGGASPSIDQVASVGGTLYFSADDGTGAGIELWKSDGTAAGTVLVKDIRAGISPSHPIQLVGAANKLFFIANDGVRFGIDGPQVWVSDGTTAGTQDIKLDGGRAFLQPYNLLASSSGAWFLSDDAFTGRTLWFSDGATGGTVRLPLTYQATSGSGIGNSIVKLGSMLYFSANDGVHGQELWKSNGTTAGTSMLVDIQVGAGSSFPSELLVHNGALYFTAQGKLWKSDGTPDGTAAVSGTAMSPSKLTSVGNHIYFLGNDGFGQELWKSDGTATGTMRVADVRPGGASSGIESLTNVNGTVYFIADNGATGREIFKSDGTAAGTVLVRDIIPGTGTAGPALLTNVNGTLFFRAGDAASGWELWKSDGTAAGTMMVKDIRPGAASSVVHLITAVGNTAYFVADDGVHGQELWKSDGSAGGTVMVKDIVPGPHGSTPASLTEISGQLAFRADDEINGPLLWKSDGTASGTQIVWSAPVNGAGYAPTDFSNVDGQLVFTARGGAYYSVWISDLTVAGTREMTIQGQVYGWGKQVRLNDALYFTGYSSTWADELFQLTIPPAGAAPTTVAGSTAPVSASPPVFEPSSSSPTAPDVFYDGSIKWDKPSYVGNAGLAGISITSGAWVEGERVNPDEAGVRAMAIQAAAQNHPLVFDIEHLPIDIRFWPEATVQMNLEKLMQVVDWAHDAAPGVTIGFYGLMPLDAAPAPSPGIGPWHEATLHTQPLIDKVDVLYSTIYNNYQPGQNQIWRTGAENMIAEARLLGKPVVPFMWPQYFHSAERLPPDVWRMQMDTVYDLADGAIIWDAGAAWTDEQPHWIITRDFLIDPAPIAPAAPAGLVATAVNAQRINLSWSDKSYNETGWRVERRVGSSGSFVSIAELPANTIAYSDQSVSASSSYSYRVVACNSAADSLASNEASATTPAGQTPPAAPLKPGAVALSSAVIRVSWMPGSQNQSGYKIERADNGGAFAEIGTAPAAATYFDDKTAALGNSFQYRVRAYNASGDSPYSGVASGSAIVSTKDPRAIWKLDDATGPSAADSSGSENTGTLAGGAAWTSGTLGGALNFDGVDDHVVVADSPSIRFAATQDFTISAWVNLTSLPGRQVGVVTKAGNGIVIDATNHWTFGSITGPVATTGWTLVTAVQDGAAGTRKLYVNGVQVASGAAAANTLGDLWIGGTATASEYFAGKIDDVRVYGDAWTAAEVSALANPHVTLNGSNENDTIFIEIDESNDNYVFTVNGVTVGSALRDAIASISVLAGDGDDLLTVDFAGGEAIAEYGITYDGGAGRDTLEIAGNRPHLSFTADATHVTRLGNTLTHSGVESFTLAAASMTINANLAMDVRVETGGVASFTAAQKLTSLIAAGGRIDVANHPVAINYSGESPLPAITNSVAYGRNGGNWLGNGIATSTPAAASLLTTIVPVEASNFLDISGSETSTWFGMTVDATTVLLVYAWAGDANLDGVINGDDYFIIDSGFSAQSQGYLSGDFDFNGVIDADDYFIIDKNYGKGGALPAAPATSPSSSAAPFFLPASTFPSLTDDESDRWLDEVL